ncbi:fumarylacetoacetate hydrolase family protein [Ramlibacter sp. H39-3-26]|uniref:2-keto-4-pentenoate hydratase n=1 Tax=Curvibacter soli TaxID=3031331 RepID=UPI0023DA2CA0|nr:fumarylacetoacetate hydrolase family protein [Ramlibacter sp. H39-3-26]MDF1486327.1 fumarylacetoacetate hydrolase family protein [Ramlibacter sp. H39-3-26]
MQQHQMTEAARLLAAAHAGGPLPAASAVLPASAAQAYALQDATLALLGPVGGWKVGSKGPGSAPNCAPLPATGLLPSGTRLPAARYPWRMVEVELALRLGSDLAVGPRDQPTPAELAQSCDAVLPAIECVEGRLAEGADAPALAKLADLLCHGALIIGPAMPPHTNAAQRLDLRTLRAALWVGEQRIQHTTGGNPAQDAWALLGWLARHCTERGVPLRRGQIVTTGSCTGLSAVPAGAWVRGELQGIGSVAVAYGEVGE